VTVAFTLAGLRALGIADASLATFPAEFREGMAARARIIGATGANSPEHWVGGLASPDLHAIAILFARDVAERERCTREHERFLRQCGAEVISSLDLQALPPYDYAHEHFGYRDRLSQPVVDGTGVEPTPGSGAPVKPGEFFLGYPDERGLQPVLPRPEILTRNGSYLAYFRLQEHVGAFRDFLREHGGESSAGQELIAAKLMGRWRSGAPMVLAPESDDPELAADMQRNNDFNYRVMDPYGYACPVGAHIRRMNPRDAAPNVQRRRMIRRGGTYGPPLPDGAPEDGVDRGIAAFIGCASLVSQFEFAMNVWANDLRHPGRHVRHDHPQATDPPEDRRCSSLHDVEGWGLLLSPWHSGSPLPRCGRSFLSQWRIKICPRPMTSLARTTKFISRENIRQADGVSACM
jgi:deferrochelatase/peroxidase EfeB